MNSVFLLKQFCSHIEEQKVSDGEGLLGFRDLLGNKKNLLKYYFQCQNYLLWELRTKYHVSLMNRHIQQLLGFNQHINEELAGHQLQTLSDYHEIDSIDKFIHWFFSAPSLIHQYANGQSCALDETMHLQLSGQLKVIISNSDSWLLLLKLPHIYQVFNSVKQKWRELTLTIHQVNYSHLPKIKFELVKNIMQSVDELEADMALNPLCFSSSVSQFIDVLFEHFYLSLKLNLLTFSQLMLDRHVQEDRLIMFEENIRDSQQQIKYHAINLARINHFNNLFAQIVNKNYSEEDVKSILFSSFKDILPLLIQHAPERGDINPVELLTEKELFWDKLFFSWINQIGCEEEFKPNFIQQLFYVTKQICEGLLKTASLRKDLYQHKKQVVQLELDSDQNSQVQRFVDRYYDNFFKQLTLKREIMFAKTSAFYLKILQQFFNDKRQQFIASVAGELRLHLSNRELNIRQQDMLDSFFCSAFNSLITEFDETYHHQFISLESVYSAIEQFNLYQLTVSRQFEMNQKDIFESEVTLKDKKDMFDHIKTIADSELPIQQRLQSIKDYVVRDSFHYNMLKYKSHEPNTTTWQAEWKTLFSQIFLYIKQLVLIGLTYLGLYQPTYQTCLQSMKDAVNCSHQTLPDINQYGFFSELIKVSLNMMSSNIVIVNN